MEIFSAICSRSEVIYSPSEKNETFYEHPFDVNMLANQLLSTWVRSLLSIQQETTHHISWKTNIYLCIGCYCLS